MVRILANLDMYRKVPVDLLEGSRRGSIISWIAIGLILTLFYKETRAFLETKLLTDLALDQNKDKRLRVHFNVTMMDLKCEYAAIDVVSVLGKEQNVTKNVQKWTVDQDGIQQQYLHRNMLQHDIDLHDSKITHTLEQLHSDKVDAVDLDPETIKYARNEHQFLFVDFFASWCSHCQALAPTWEVLAEIMADAADHHIHKGDYKDLEYESAKKVALPVLIGKVDCVQQHDLCMEHAITGYPTLRLFVNGQPYGDYWGHRTILGFTQFLAMAEESISEDKKVKQASEIAMRKLEISEEERQWAEALERTRHKTMQRWKADEHPGCMIAGILLMDRTPGHFYIQARSPNHNVAPHMTNVSHVVNHLAFGDHGLRRYVKDVTPPNFDESTKPMNGNVYVTNDLHEAYHHYLKLVSTNLFSYQVLQSSQLSYYKQDQVPEAKFIIDLSPIAVTYRNQSRKWYDYVTSLMAIIGGTFTVVGMVEGGLRAATSRRRKY